MSGIERAILAALAALIAGLLLSPPIRDGAALALLALLVLDRGRGHEERLRASDLAAAAFLGVTALSAWLAPAPGTDFDDLAYYPLGALVYVGARRVAAGPAAAALSLLVLLVVDLFAADVLLQAALGTSPIGGRGPVWGRYTGPFPFPSDVSLLPMLAPLAAPAATALGAGAGLASLALLLAAVVASGTRAALVALLVPLAGAAVASRGRRRLLLAGLLTIAVVGAAAAASGAFPVRRLLGEGTGPQHRWVQWQASVVLAAERPLLGHGPHTFRRLVLERAAQGDRLARRIQPSYAPYPHDVYLETAVGSGLVGLAALLALLATPFVAARPASERSAPWLGVARLSLATFALVAVLDQSLKKDWVQLALWLPLGMAAGASAPWRERSRR